MTTPSPDVRGFRLRGWVSLRWVLTHMIKGSYGSRTYP